MKNITLRYTDGNVPPISGTNKIGIVYLCVNDPKIVQEIYTNMNKFHTKTQDARDTFS